MRLLLAATWPLLLGIGFIMTGNALQGSLLGYRAAREGFAEFTMGVITCGYYVGLIAGSFTVPRIVKRVGHVRVFAALASLATVAILVHGAFVNPPIWFLMRACTGFAYCGMYIVAESWLNDRSTNETRGQMLSAYMIMQFGGLTVGQLLLNLEDPARFELFALVAGLISVATIPTLLSTGPVPRFEAPLHLSLVAFFRLSPLAVLGSFAVGAAHGVFYNMGSYYAEAIGLSAFQVSIFMTLAVLGAGLFQWPLGRLSDRFDRRWVIALAALLAGLAAALALPARAFATGPLLGLMFLFGGLALPLYSLLGAFANDRLKPEQMVAASSSIVLCYGIGAFFGPLLVGLAMGRLGPDSFLAYLAAIHLALGLFTLYRMLRRPGRRKA